MTTIYRASDDTTARQGAHFAAAAEDADAYTRNPGFGGANLNAYDVDLSDTLDVTGPDEDARIALAAAYLAGLDADDREDAEYDIRWELSDLYGCESEQVSGSDVARAIAMAWGESGHIRVFEVLENVSGVVEAITSYAWVSYTDDYPERCTTYRLLADIEIVPAN